MTNANDLIDDPSERRVFRPGAADQPVGELRIGLVEQPLEGLTPGVIRKRPASFEPSFQQQVEFLHPAPAAPAQPSLALVGHDQESRVSRRRLMSAIARAGLRSFGQASVQFMMVWQR